MRKAVHHLLLKRPIFLDYFRGQANAFGCETNHLYPAILIAIRAANQPVFLQAVNERRHIAVSPEDLGAEVGNGKLLVIIYPHQDAVFGNAQPPLFELFGHMAMDGVVGPAQLDIGFMGIRIGK